MPEDLHKKHCWGFLFLSGKMRRGEGAVTSSGTHIQQLPSDPVDTFRAGTERTAVFFIAWKNKGKASISISFVAITTLCCD